MAVEERYAVRGLVLTPAREVLLIRLNPPTPIPRFWVAPGGGMEPGETAEQTLKRELIEELGLSGVEIGPVVWRRHHTFDWGARRISQREEYRIVPAERFNPVMSDLIEAQGLDCFRWWRVQDLAAATERLTPFALPQILARYLAEGAPDPLPDEEILVDW